MQLLDSIYDFIDPQANDFFSRSEYLDLDESVLTTLLSRKTLQISELKKFQAMQGWVSQQLAKKLKLKQEQQNQQLLQEKQPLQRQDSTSKPSRTASIEKQESTEQQIATEDPKHLAESALGAIDEKLEADKTPGIVATTSIDDPKPDNPQQSDEPTSREIDSHEYRNLLTRLVKAVNIKLDKITNEDIVKYILPTKVFSNDKIFDAMADESRIDY